MSDSKSDADVVKTVGRGVIYITAAKIWFLVVGYVLIFVLPRIFKWTSGGDAEQGQALFGTYKIVFMGVSFINNGIITGTIQAVSKFTSEDESNAGAVRRTGLKVQGALGIILAVIYIGFADFIARILGSPDLALLMRVTAGIIVAYSLYAVYIGSFNGRRLFNRQALFDVIYATIKTALIIGLAAAGFEVLGTVLGFLIAAVVIAIAASIFSSAASKGTFPAKPYIAFAAKLIIYTFILNLVMSLDLFLLKGIASKSAIALGQSHEAASQASKVLAGRYGAIQGLAFIPYQAILSIAFVAFPMISKVTFSRDAEKTRIYVLKTMRFTTILIVGLAAVFAAVPGQAIGFVFEPEYLVAKDALGILSIGIAAFGLMVVSNTILNGAGLPYKAMAVIVVALLALIGSVYGFLSMAGPGPEALAATAMGSTLGMFLGLLISGIVVYRCLGAFWPWLTVLRVVIAAGAAIALGRFLPDAGRIITLFECILVLVVYFAVLLCTREFRREDLNQLKQVLKRGS